MNSDRQNETNAAAQAEGRELIVSALQRNPIVALAAGLLGPGRSDGVISRFETQRP